MDLFDILLITLSALAILAFAVGILSFARTSDQRQQQPPHLPQPVQPVQNALQQGHELARVVQHGAANAQGVGLALRRRRPGVEGAEAAVALGGDVAGEEAEGDAADAAALPVADAADIPGHRHAKHSKKAMSKALKQQEKEHRRQRIQAQEEAKRQRMDALEERRRERDAEFEAQERAQEEERARALQEQAELERAEYDQWRGLISVEGAGAVVEEGGSQSQSMLQEFIAYVKQQKVVQLNDLAQQFGMATTDVIARLTELDKMGRLPGIIDERGKFIHVTEEEMDRVAEFVRRRGRVSVAQLAAASSELVRLEPSAAGSVLASE